MLQFRLLIPYSTYQQCCDLISFLLFHSSLLQLSLSLSLSCVDSFISVFPHKSQFLISPGFFLTLSSGCSPKPPSNSLSQGVQDGLTNSQEQNYYFIEWDVCLFHDSMMFLTMSNLWSK